MATHRAIPRQPRPYEAKDYDGLLGATGFSDEMLSTHFQLYQGYVKHTNKALAILNDEDIEDYARKEVQRRFVWEFNGMRLHELYFDAMGGTAHPPERDAPLGAAIAASFGGFERWLDDFRFVGATRGVGWAALVSDPQAGRLLNMWVNEHDAGPLARTDILLIMDVWEHAFMRDFGTDRKKYMNMYFDTVDWDVISGRFERSQANATGAERRKLNPRRS